MGSRALSHFFVCTLFLTTLCALPSWAAARAILQDDAEVEIAGVATSEELSEPVPEVAGDVVEETLQEIKEEDEIKEEIAEEERQVEIAEAMAEEDSTAELLHTVLEATGESPAEQELLAAGINLKNIVHSGVAKALHDLKHPKINDVEYVPEDSPVFKKEKDLDFWTGFIRSYLVILVIEVGDRTFFIAALMAIKHSQLTVFLGAFTALTIMTVVSTVLGVAAPLLLPRTVTHYVATILFTFFGGQMIYKAYGMSDGVSEELEEVEEELEKKGEEDVPTEWWRPYFNPVFVQALTMTAIAEWGDRSQIATIAMAADLNPYGISVGGSLGHGCATAGAVMGGRLIASKISERTITIMGGIVFLIFGIMAFFEDPEEDMGNSIPAWMTFSSKETV